MNKKIPIPKGYRRLTKKDKIRPTDLGTSIGNHTENFKNGGYLKASFLGSEGLSPSYAEGALIFIRKIK